MMPHAPRCAGCVVLTLAALVVQLGCQKRGESLESLLAHAATLPGVRASRQSALREEFRLVEQSHTLPSELNTDASLVHQNAAVALEHALPDLEQISKINSETESFLDTLGAADPSLVAQEARLMGTKWSKQTKAVFEASKLPGCDYGIRFDRGYFNDLSFVYRSAAACRLLLVDAVSDLESPANVAIARFDAAWRWTDWLANSEHLEARVQAAHLRSEALAVAEMIAGRPGVTADDLRAIYRTLDNTLRHWPSMRGTLVRERAMAIITYEAIRLGLADLLFTADEREQLRADGVYDSLRVAKEQQIDADEAAYLAYMREIIDVSDQPYYIRSKHLVECDRLLRANEQTDDYPWFANHLFVLDNSLTLAQAELARDRARVEGWVFLLANLTGEPAPTNHTNPLNGEKYKVTTRGHERYVDLGDRRSANPHVTLAIQ
ncbi:hypothetical protein [Aeoliella sp. SH292]|uniref:hypothetical protein n=1 Tax=Aeoliella sp. SH292 TaxID=3454464 RepID=UPI003F9D00D8